MSALKHDLFNIFKTLSSASNIDFEVTDANGQTVEDLARLVWKIYDTFYILLFFLEIPRKIENILIIFLVPLSSDRE